MDRNVRNATLTFQWEPEDYDHVWMEFNMNEDSSIEELTEKFKAFLVAMTWSPSLTDEIELVKKG